MMCGIHGEFLIASHDANPCIVFLGMFVSRYHLFNAVRKFACLTLVMLVALFLAGVTLNWCYHFHPSNVKKVNDPVVKANVAFTEVGGFTDICVDLYASDWPWTFGKPAYLGDFYWPQAQRSCAAYWSADGSVLAFQTQGREDDSSLFRSAYDYRKHKLIKPDYVARGPKECHLQILALILERGGIGPQETRLDDFKEDRGAHSFPFWGWIAPGSFILGGILTIAKLRKSKA